MKRLRHIAKRLGRPVLAIGFILAMASVAAACPTCKDQLAHDPASSNLARGYVMSILFMLSMPATLLGGFSLGFYRLHRKQQALLAQQANPESADPQA